MALTNPVNRKVCYYYDSDVGNYYYGQGHPMKPHRIRMTHNLLLNYGLYRKMEIFRPHKCTSDEMTKYHSDDYIKFLRSIRPDNMSEYTKQMQRFNVGEDCPVFDGLYEFCQLSGGGSIAGAVKINKQQTDIAINWGGGLHHAKKSEASGFCYDIGAGKGKYYALNFPLRDGMDDASYEEIFQPVVTKVMEYYQPSAVVLQCGADSLTGDRLGCFNLTVKGHAKCLDFMKKFNVPILMLGGGGYTIRNVARCWTYETAVALGQDIPNELPYNDYFEYFGPDFKLHISPSNMTNQNTQEYLHKIRQRLFENLRMLPHAPGVQMSEIPPDGVPEESDDEEHEDPDKRISMRASDKRIQRDDEYSDSEDEGDGGRKNEEIHKKKRKLESDTPKEEVKKQEVQKDSDSVKTADQPKEAMDTSAEPEKPNEKDAARKEEGQNLESGKEGDQEKPAAPTAIDKSEANAESAATKSSNDEQNEVEKMET